MKKFLLFAGAHYYPSGGWGDFRGAFDTVEDAVHATLPNETLTGLDYALQFRPDWWHVVDTTTGAIVREQYT